MRGAVVLVALVAVLAVTAVAEPPGPTRWQQATNPPALSRVWGIGGAIYGTSATGVFRSFDNGATWAMVSTGAANGVWGAARDDLWIVRAKTIHQSATGVHWTTQELPMLSYAARLEGMWGTGRERYLFGADRTGVILHSRDGGASWRAESLPVEVARIAGVWGSAANDVYAVGARGVILHSEGDGQWRIVRAPTTGSLEGIWGASATSVYAVGTNGAIVHSADRGKTWKPRPSGVTYTLSSIAGVGGELFASSVDGPPLRSSDGLAWKPITAMVRRGHAWAFEGERIVVAGGREVHFLGEVEQAAAPVLPLPMPDDRLATVMAYAESFGKRLPSARDLLHVAAHQIGRPTKLDPTLALTRPALRIGKISGCSAALDARSTSPKPRVLGTELVVDLACVQTCAATRTPSVKQHVKIWRDGQLRRSIEVVFNAPDGWCKGTDAELQSNHNSVAFAFVRDLDRELALGLAKALSDEARVDAYARYVLDGGSSSAAHDELARMLGRPYTWRGFVWNQPRPMAVPLPRVRPPTCNDAVKVATLESQGDLAQGAGNYARALAHYDAIVDCKPALLTKAYLSACRAGSFGRAAEIFLRLNKPSLAQICMKAGFDPRPSATPVSTP